MKKTEPLLLRRVAKMSNPASVEEFIALDGFQGLRKAVAMDKTKILDEISIAHLRGRGGAAYPAGRKWLHLYHIQGAPKYIVCNADEGEPGTFKDKILLEQDPLSIIEGMLIAGYVFDSPRGFIYIRGEYRPIQKIFQEALDNATRAGFLGENILGIPGFNYAITIVSGAGAYVCGENSALLNSIEGRTGRPRVKPPHLAEVGLYLQPTLVNNVESFACIPAIISMGGQAFLDLGTKDGGGTKLISISGHAKNRGVFEVPLGTPMRDILYDEAYGGGTSTGKPIGFCHLGGQSGPIAFPEQFDVLYSYQALWDNDLALGAGALVVMDESVSIVDYVRRVAEFFVHESCGKCTPCRVGTTRLLECLDLFVSRKATLADLERLEKLLLHITRLSACGLGQSAGVAVTSALKYRRTAFETVSSGREVALG